MAISRHELRIMSCIGLVRWMKTTRKEQSHCVGVCCLKGSAHKRDCCLDVKKFRTVPSHRVLWLVSLRNLRMAITTCFTNQVHVYILLIPRIHASS